MGVWHMTKLGGGNIVIVCMNKDPTTVVTTLQLP